ncbi:MAG: hypothetical protein ACI85I_002712 [Arenicella sp.]
MIAKSLICWELNFILGTKLIEDFLKCNTIAFKEIFVDE